MSKPRDAWTDSKWTIADRLDRSVTSAAIRTGSWIAAAEIFLGMWSGHAAPSSENTAPSHLQSSNKPQQA